MATSRKLLSVALVLAGSLPATLALALDNDPRLDRLCRPNPIDSDQNGAVDRPCGDAPAGDQDAFAKLAREYGMALAPRLLAPADTLGINGFQISSHIGLTNINQDEEYWSRAVSDQSPPSILTTLHVDARKGLPYSVEVGVNMGWLFDSELFAFGGMLKWAPNEGIDAFPVDLALRFSANRTVGSSQFDMTTFGGDLIISRAFGAGGVANIAPYMAYSPAFVFARSGVLDSTPGEATDSARSFVLEEEQIVLHRFVVGVRLVVGGVNFTPEAALTEGLQSYNFNLGLDF